MLWGGRVWGKTPDGATLFNSQTLPASTISRSNITSLGCDGVQIYGPSILIRYSDIRKGNNQGAGRLPCHKCSTWRRGAFASMGPIRRAHVGSMRFLKDITDGLKGGCFFMRRWLSVGVNV